MAEIDGIRLELLGTDGQWQFGRWDPRTLGLAYTFRFTRQGLARWTTPGGTFLTTNHDVVLVPPGADLAGEGHQAFMYLEVPARLYDQVVRAMPPLAVPLSLVCNNYQCNDLDHRLYSLYFELTENPVGQGLGAQTQCLNLLTYVWRAALGLPANYGEMPLVRGRQKQFALMHRIAGRLETHPEERADVTELARRVGLNRATFCDYFLMFTLSTPIQYRLHCQMESAVRLMATSDASIEDIAAATGFGDLRYFYRVFTRYYEMSPAAFRSWAQGIPPAHLEKKLRKRP